MVFTSEHQICFSQFVQSSEVGLCQNEFWLGRGFFGMHGEKNVYYVFRVSDTTGEDAFHSAGQLSATNLSSVTPWCDLSCLNVTDLSCSCSANMP